MNAEKIKKLYDNDIKAKDGVSIDSIELNDDRELICKLSNGNEFNLGCFDGVDGERGIDGESGAAGSEGKQGIQGEHGADGENGIDALDGKPGERGLRGEQGPIGKTGADGKPGLNGKVPEHEIDNINGRIRFRKPNGSWGVWLDIPKQIIQTIGGGGLSEVIHDATMTGKGTNSDPLSVVGSTGGTGFPFYFIPASESVTVPVNRQHLISGEVVVEGEFIIEGEAVTI